MVDLLSAAVPALAESIDAKRLLVFAGSGISKAPPSCLPDWAGFNASLLDPIKAWALSIPGFSSVARQAIQTLEVEPSRALAFSEFLVQELARDSYFPVLQVLDSSEPNDYHAALAGLARTGILRAIVTTNFDTLIERAFREAGMPYMTYVTLDDYRRDPAGEACGVFKIHGSVTSAITLRDTVSQKTRGLPLFVRARLAALYREHHVLVVGFSGADLEFGNDYLAFSSISNSGPGITWMVRPSGETTTNDIIPCPISTLPQAVQAVLNRAGPRGAVIKADFLRVCELLNAREPVKTVLDAKAAQATADRNARKWAAEWFETIGRTPLQCALFCSGFLRTAGRQQDADAINATLEPLLGAIREQDPLSAANLAMVLAENAKEQGRTDRIEQLSQLALETADLIADRRPESEESLWKKLCATAWSNLGLVHLSRGDRPNAKKAHENATRLAALLEDPTTLGSMYLNSAVLANRPDELERRLELIRQSTALTLRGESRQSAYAGLQFEAVTLIGLAEYDAARVALQEARRFVKLANDPLRGMFSIEIPDADIKRLRGQAGEALAQIEVLLPLLDAHPMFAAQIRVALLEMLEDFPALHAALVRQADWILGQMARGMVPSDGSVAHFPSEPALRAWRTRLESGASPSTPSFLQFAEPPRDLEDACRRNILGFEFHQQLSQLPECFDILGKLKYEERNAWRLLDAAEGLIAACERASNEALRLEGLHRKSIASQILGDIWASIDSLEAILQAQPPAPPSLQALVHRDLSTSFSRIGNRQETERQFRVAMTQHRALAEFHEAAIDVFNFADALTRFDDFAGALTELNNAADLVAGTRSAEFHERWVVSRALFTRLQTRSGADLLELPPGFMPETEPPVAIRVIEDERCCIESAEELRLLALEASRSAHHEEAAALSLQAQKEFARGVDRLGVAQCIHDQAEIAQARGNWGSAREQSQWALDLRTRLGDVTGQIESGAVCALGWFQLGELHEAGDAAQAALVLAKGRGPSRWILIGWLVLAAVLERIGSSADFRAVLVRFLEEFPPDKRRPLLTAVRDRFESRLMSLGL